MVETTEDVVDSTADAVEGTDDVVETVDTEEVVVEADYWSQTMEWASDSASDFVWSKQNKWKKKWDNIPNSVTPITGLPTTIKINTDENGAS